MPLQRGQGREKNDGRDWGKDEKGRTQHQHLKGRVGHLSSITPRFVSSFSSISLRASPSPLLPSPASGTATAAGGNEEQNVISSRPSAPLRAHLCQGWLRLILRISRFLINLTCRYGARSSFALCLFNDAVNTDHLHHFLTQLHAWLPLVHQVRLRTFALDTLSKIEAIAVNPLFRVLPWWQSILKLKESSGFAYPKSGQQL